MLIGKVFGDRYQLDAFIGEGGMSLVYRAVDRRTGHYVAIKILKSEYNSDAEFLERFQREAQAASLMSHHNLVNLLDMNVEGEYRYLVLEYVEGYTLKEYIQKQGRLPYDTAIAIAVRILSGLAHAHGNGIIHRDIKPQNVLINSAGNVKVADFGIARIANMFTVARSDTVVGSVHYASPEQVQGKSVNATGDLYSTGVVMYEMLTGRVPFTGDSPVAVAMQHVNNAPPPIERFAPETPPAVIAVVMKALEKKPENRFQSAHDMAAALKAAAEGKLDPSTLHLTPPEAMAAAADPNGAAGNPAGGAANGAQNAGAPGGAGSASQNQSGKSQNKKRHHIRMLISIVLAVAAMALIVLAVLRVFERVANIVMAPPIVGMTDVQARSEVEREGLTLQISTAYHDTVPAGVIISQLPAADTELERGDSILATVSLGPSTTVTPNVLNQMYDLATETLLSAGFSNVVVVKTVSSYPVGTVLSQVPGPDTGYSTGEAAELTVSGGSAVVPDVTRRSVSAAMQMLSEAQLAAAEIVYSETADESLIGQVLTQVPEGGTMVVLGASVTMTVGKESEPYHAELSISLPRIDENGSLRVVLEDDRGEHTAYETALSTAPATVMLIPLDSSTPGEHRCVVYLNDGVILDEPVTFY